MTITLLNAEVILSKDLGDFWEGTTTSATASTTVTDTALQAKANDWITDATYDMITSGSRNEEERKVSSLDNTSGAMTVLAHGGSVASGVTYRVHRLFEASEKRRALIEAASNIYPDCYDLVWNEEIVSGNWLKDGSFERWTTTTNLTDWVETGVTCTLVSAEGLFKHGSASAQLTTAIGSLSQGITQNDDLKFLAGKAVTLTAQGWCSTASCLRLSVYDGTTRTYSSYHDGGTSWTQDNPRNDSFYLQATIDYNPTEVTIQVHHEIAGGTSRVDDVRLISGYRDRLYIGNLGLPQNVPANIYIEPTYYSHEQPWDTIHDWEIDEAGYLHLPTSVPNDRRLRIIGQAYLDFLSSGTPSTSWSATINLGTQEAHILTAEAARWLYSQMSMPNFETGRREEYQNALSYWNAEVKRRKGKFGMPTIPITNSWGHE